MIEDEVIVGCAVRLNALRSPRTRPLESRCGISFLAWT